MPIKYTNLIVERFIVNPSETYLIAWRISETRIQCRVFIYPKNVDLLFNEHGVYVGDDTIITKVLQADPLLESSITNKYKATLSAFSLQRDNLDAFTTCVDSFLLILKHIKENFNSKFHS